MFKFWALINNKHIIVEHLKGRRKKRISYGQADRKGGGGGVSPLGPDRKKMWKFWLIFFIEIWFFDTQKTFFLIVRGLENAFFMSLTPLLYCYPTILWQSSSKQ